MSKSFAMAGLRIGWLATRDRELLARCAALKDYTTICSAAPSEVLALIALRARDVVLDRSRSIVEANLARVDRFFDAWADRFTWVRPKAGSVVVGPGCLLAPPSAESPQPEATSQKLRTNRTKCFMGPHEKNVGGTIPQLHAGTVPFKVPRKVPRRGSRPAGSPDSDNSALRRVR